MCQFEQGYVQAFVDEQFRHYAFFANAHNAAHPGQLARSEEAPKSTPAVRFMAARTRRRDAFLHFIHAASCLCLGFSTRRTAMLLPEIRLVQAAVVPGRRTEFLQGRATAGHPSVRTEPVYCGARRSANVLLFERDHRKVELTAAGRKFVADARPAMEVIERAMVFARAASDGAGEVLNIGRSAYTDPWLAAVVRSVHLPLYPRLRINWLSRYSHGWRTKSALEPSISRSPQAFPIPRPSHFCGWRSIPSSSPCHGVTLWLPVPNCGLPIIPRKSASTFAGSRAHGQSCLRRFS